MPSTRFVTLIVLLAVALLANGDSTSKSIYPTSVSDPTPAHYSSTSVNYEKRVLMIDETTNSEERRNIPPPSFALFANMAKSWVLKIKSIIKARYWLWRRKSAEDVFIQLKLDRGLDRILDNPNMKTWTTYVDLLNKKNPEKKVSMAKILIDTYGDLPVAIMLQTTKAIRNAVRLAIRLRGEQNILWKNSYKSSDDVFTLLKLDKVGDDMFVSPQLNSWYNYVSWSEQEKAKTVMATVLLKHYDQEDLSRMFREATPQVKRMRFVALWLENAIEMHLRTPERYFMDLKLNAGLDKLLTNPNLSRWVTFVGDFNDRNPGKTTTMIDIFTKFYGDIALAKAFETAQYIEKTRRTASIFQFAQFRQWQRDDKKLEMIKGILKVEKATGLYAVIWRRYERFNAKYPLKPKE